MKTSHKEDLFIKALPLHPILKMKTSRKEDFHFEFDGPLPQTDDKVVYLYLQEWKIELLMEKIRLQIWVRWFCP